MNIKVIILGLVALVSSIDGHTDESIDTASIKASAQSSSCSEFKVVGVCLWLVCGLDGCEIEKSIKVGHYNPDLVVSSFNGLGKSPWKEMQAELSEVEKEDTESALAALGGFLPQTAGGMTGGRANGNLRFKEAHAIGHPMAGRIYCPSDATAFNPYFVSALDAIAWRWGVPEIVYPQALIPGTREIGSWPSNTWGSVYPRSGWVTQPSDPKAAAVTAQRVGDIVTRGTQPHIYQKLKTGGTFTEDEKRVWRPTDPLKEGDDKTGQWQMLTPKSTDGCITFGKDDTEIITGWDGGKSSNGGDYAWTLWRPYACCKVKGMFITSVDIMSFP